MNKFILIPILTILLSGCSFLPRVTFDKAGVTPQKTEKSSKREVCVGDYKMDLDGNIISCSKGYSKTENNYKQAERRYTFQERIANMIRGLAGWSFFLIIALLILCPSVAGWLIGRVFNVFRSGLEGTVRAIGRFKANIPTVNINGVELPDPNYVKAVDALLDHLEEEHSKDPNILKTISDIRLKLKIEDND